jgi:hypothetical protein
MIERTKARLEEARTLLDKLQAEKFRQVQQANPTASRAFLSLINDFITTARTVRWALKNEETEKYKAWLSSPGAALSPAEEQIFKLTNDMRVSIEKRGHSGIEARREQVRNPAAPSCC